MLSTDMGENSAHHHRRRHFLRSLSLQQLMHTHEREKVVSCSLSMGRPPKGWVVVKVGEEDGEDDRRRFAVPVGFLNHFLFARLLEEAEREYGFRQQGAIVIPCNVQHFMHVLERIELEMGGAGSGGQAAGNQQLHHHHHHHHHRQHSQSVHLPHFAAACFGREG